jgi:hypothetical protein
MMNYMVRGRERSYSLFHYVIPTCAGSDRANYRDVNSLQPAYGLRNKSIPLMRSNRALRRSYKQSEWQVAKKGSL